MAYVSERISRTELGCLFAAHVSKSKYDIFDWITTGVFSAYDIIVVILAPLGPDQSERSKIFLHQSESSI